jgi:hypothetical protein
LAGFHGGTYIIGGSAALESNVFYRNSFGNIVIQDLNSAKILGNRILFPGDGRSGDGVTAIDIGKLNIKGNEIIAGGCYSIALFGESYAIDIGNNQLSHSPTSAIVVQPDANIGMLTLSNNRFIGNRYMALEIRGRTQNLTVMGNFFKRHPTLNSIRMASYEGGQVDMLKVSGNLLFEESNPNLPYRSYTNVFENFNPFLP